MSHWLYTQSSTDFYPQELMAVLWGFAFSVKALVKAMALHWYRRWAMWGGLR